jgi:putative Mg2+ transporter-C (MgtC) family protein
VIEHFGLEQTGAFLRLFEALACGVAIGLEREIRRRPAGVHTIGLVAIGAALFAMIAPLLGIKGDPTRIVGQVVTGVGFLAGGVILRQGGDVSGLNTAATMWATSAVGALAGLGYLQEAIVGSLAIIMTNGVLAYSPVLVERFVPSGKGLGTSYKVEVTCADSACDGVRDTIVRGTVSNSLTLRSLVTSDDGQGEADVTADLVAPGRGDQAIVALVAELRRNEQVKQARWDTTQRFGTTPV